MTKDNFTCTYNRHSVLYGSLFTGPHVILRDYKTQPLNLTEEEGGRREQERGEEQSQ